MDQSIVSASDQDGIGPEVGPPARSTERDLVGQGRVEACAAARACCCYAVDEAYLLPTLLSASQLRRGTPRATADVVVVCFGPATDVTAAAAALCAREGIRFLTVPTSLLDGAPMICARFFLCDVLERDYRDIVYLDGDTQVAGSLEPLLAHAVKPGEILAAPDPMAVMIDSGKAPWPARRAYFERLGVPLHRQGAYFNSGVLRFRREDWHDLSRECLKLCAERGAAFEFRDQDALNIVAGGHQRPMSFRWNFPPFFMNFGADVAIAPRVYHFMSNPRPWHGAFAPWGRAWHDPYRAFLVENPALARSMRRIGPLRTMKYAAQQRFKRHMEARQWGAPAIRRRIADMEAQAVV